jgi:hypothetical protein
MPFGFVQDVPVNEDTYRQIRAQLGDAPPPGLIAHVVIKHENGLRHVNVWETQQAWQTFHDEKLWPAVSSVLATLGIHPDPSQDAVRETVDVIDAWVQPAQVPASLGHVV